MSFLTPLYLAGLLAVSLPLVFHLIRRTPRGRLPFGSLMFLAPSPPRLTRKSRLDNLLLLLLRVLALCLLAVAFGRPFLRAAAQLDIFSPRARRIAILVDTSASMQRADLWRRALAEADQALEDITPADQAALFTFDDELRTLVGLDDPGSLTPARARALVRSRLQQSAPTWAATDLGAALVAVAELLEAANDLKQSDAVLQIVLVTDLQQGSRLGALEAYEWPDRVHLDVRRVSPSRSTNAGLELVTEGRELEVGAAESRVRITNASDSRREEFELSWGGASERATTDEPLRVYVPSGQSRVVRMTPPPKEGQVNRLLLSGDDHDFDNTYYVAPLQQKEVTLFYIGSDAADDPEGLQYYLNRAFSDTARRKVLVESSETADPLLARAVHSAQLVVVGETPPADLVDLLRRRLRRGGAVLYVLREGGDDAATLAAIMECENVRVEEADIRDYAMFGEIDFTHPLFSSLAGPRFNDFTKIHFWKHRRVQIEEPSPVRVVAKFDSGDPAILERVFDPGRLFVLTTSWRPADSQFALSASKFVPLVASILECSGGEESRRPFYHVNERVTFAGDHASSERRVVRTPDGAEVELANDAVAFSGTGRPGVYRVAFADGPWQFAVNIAASESRTAPLELDELEQRGVRLQRRPTRAEEIEQRRQRRDVELENGQQLWRWLVSATLLVLIVETWTAGRFARRAAAEAKATE